MDLSILQWIEWRRALLLTGLLLTVWATAHAERLPLKSYTVADGLAHNSVHPMFQDAKGFLWLATAEGLSRFDGYNFTNYGMEDGLGHIYVNHIAVDRAGRLWVATNGGGVSLLMDEPSKNISTSARKKFVSFLIEEGGERNQANLVNRILFDAENRLWCLTDGGLFRARQIEVAERDFECVTTCSANPSYTANSLLADSRGRLWFGIDKQAIQIAGGKMMSYEPTREANPANAKIPVWDVVTGFAEDAGGRVLAASAKGIYEFVEPQNENERGAWRKLPLELQVEQTIEAFARDPASDDLWIGTNIGLVRYLDGRQTLYTTANGLSVNWVNSLLADREGNLWIGTQNGGVNKLAGESVVSYTVAQGLPFAEAYRLTSDRDGNIYAQSGCATGSFVQITDEKITIVPNAEFKMGYCLRNQLLQDRRGRWWFATQRGLEISDAPQLDFKSGRLLTSADGLIEPFWEMYEDPEGKMWVLAGGKVFMTDAKLAGTPRFELVTKDAPTAGFILRDAAGTVWLADRIQLWRLRNGKVEEIKQIENLPIIQPRYLFLDSRGRVWIGTRYNGAIVTDEPAAEHPRFKNYAVREGLASNTVWTIAEDNEGKIYFGTGRGVDRLDETTNKIRHFTNEDGVAGSVINHLHRDRRGNIWVASNGGVSRINPRAVRGETRPPPVLINRITIAGEELPLSETGATNISALQLQANRNNIAVSFVGLSFQTERALRYQYQLEGVDADWSAPGEQREVTYANLGAGEFRFLVRAVNAAGLASEQPAVFEFQILPPVWQRWWFIAVAVLGVGGLIYAVYRFRVARLLEVERMRTRIATDLHDDIGANLTKIAILSEVAKQRLGSGEALPDSPLSAIARISRESVAAMGDIVWAINPERDHLIDLVRRMRQHAGEVFTPRDIELGFHAPDAAPDLKLEVDVRRDLFLIFKEAVNNAARHANCERVEIDFRADGARLFLSVADDGVGFDPSNDGEGHGLLNMSRRAARLGGQLTVESRPGQGTNVRLSLPDARPRRFRETV